MPAQQIYWSLGGACWPPSSESAAAVGRTGPRERASFSRQSCKPFCSSLIASSICLYWLSRCACARGRRTDCDPRPGAVSGSRPGSVSTHWPEARAALRRVQGRDLLANGIRGRGPVFFHCLERPGSFFPGHLLIAGLLASRSLKPSISVFRLVMLAFWALFCCCRAWTRSQLLLMRVLNSSCA